MLRISNFHDIQRKVLYFSAVFQQKIDFANGSKVSLCYASFKVGTLHRHHLSHPLSLCSSCHGVLFPLALYGLVSLTPSFKWPPHDSLAALPPFHVTVVSRPVLVRGFNCPLILCEATTIAFKLCKAFQFQWWLVDVKPFVTGALPWLGTACPSLCRGRWFVFPPGVRHASSLKAL